MQRLLTPHRLLGFSILFLLLLWLPGLQVPLVSDPAHYALLGESLWTTGHYAIFGVPHARFLPLHPFVSYPFEFLFGYGDGMKISSLIGAMGAVCAAFLLLKRACSPWVAAWAAVLLATHHGFVYNATTGSADMIFLFLFLLSLWAFMRAEDDRRWYWLAGVLAGLACLTRYNGAPLFLFYPFWILWKRRQDFFTASFLGGMTAGGLLFALWFLRTYLVFGNPFHSEYVDYVGDACPSLITQFFSNLRYYANPVQNIMPILMITAIWGMIVTWRSQLFLLFALAAAECMTAVWCVQGIRFALPGYPILMGFGVFGLLDLAGRLGRFRPPFLVAAVTGIIVSHAAAFLLYTYGATNAWWDRTIGMVPPRLGVSSEALYGRAEAHRFINAHAESGAWVIAYEEPLAVIWSQGEFRDDLLITADATRCPRYVIKENDVQGALFTSESQPFMSVHKEECDEGVTSSP